MSVLKHVFGDPTAARYRAPTTLPVADGGYGAVHEALRHGAPPAVGGDGEDKPEGGGPGRVERGRARSEHRPAVA